MSKPPGQPATPPEMSEPRTVSRRLARVADPVDQATVVGWIRRQGVPGVVPIENVVLVQDRVEVEEAPIHGCCLGTALEAVHRHISTAVALVLVRDAALALSGVHLLDEDRPPVHGRLGLKDLILATDGRLVLSGFQGLRGDPQEDVQALIEALRELLRPKARKPGGAALLDRLSALRFTSAQDLYRTIVGHLDKQPSERVDAARARFTSRVLEALGGPSLWPVADREGPDQADFPVREATFGLPNGSASTSGARVEDESVVHAQLQAALEDAFSTSEEEDGLSDAPEGMPEFDDADDVTEASKERAPSLRMPVARAPSYPTSHVPSADLAYLAAKSPLDEDLAAEAVTTEQPPRPPTPAQTAVPKPRRLNSDVAIADGILAPAAAREDKPGAILIGDYRVVAAIGKGGMGEIYLARSVASDRLVALKVLGAQDAGDDEALGMLMDEAAIMARIEHPHVLKVLDFGQAQGRYYLASEYLEGRPLVRVMIESYDRDGGMDHAAVACVGAQAARGLHAAHTSCTPSGLPLEVVHRDVSPQNIFVTYIGEAKVIDFGVARATERFSQTQVGLVKGKAAYMSPEQAEGRPIDARSDVFSLGVCLWEMVAGKRLFKKSLDYDTLVAVQTAPIGAPSAVRGRPDDALDRIILRALHRDPDVRTPSAAALADELENYARAVGVKDSRITVRRMMDGLFHDESIKERALVAQLEARAATAEDIASLRELSGVGQKGPTPRGGNVHVGGRSDEDPHITVVGEPNGLRALDRYGEGRRELTGERVIRKVKWLEAERRSGEHPAQRFDTPAVIRDDPTDRLRQESLAGLDLADTPDLVTSAAYRPGHRWWLWLWLAVVPAAVGLGVLFVFLARSPNSGAQLPQEPASDEVQVKVTSRSVLAESLRKAGARVEPVDGPVQRVEGLGDVPLMLDGRSRIRRVESGSARGWLLELTPVDGGPAVAWILDGDQGLMARGLSVNDCPAEARVDAAGVEVDYGEGTTRLPHGGGRLVDVALEAPSGAEGLLVKPLGIALGQPRAVEPATLCPSGWEGNGRVVLRRLPIGRYSLEWRGPGLSLPGTLHLTRTGIRGGEPL